jgi:calcium-dependent protein kinase
MEYCGGGDLFDKITSQKDGVSFSENKAANIMKKLFLGINHCHSNGVVHRDLKPENIMYKDITTINESQITQEGPFNMLEVKIIDFGLSKILQNFTQTG